MMKTQSICQILSSGVLIFGLCLTFPVVESGQAQSLTPDQIEEISEQLQAIRKVLTDKASSRNKSAADIFLAASGSDKEALALYVKCYKEVYFDRDGRKESDFRDWRDKQADHFRDDSFTEGLRIQLRYLGLSCKAAEAEELSEVFGSLMSYVDSLTQLEELPGNEVMQSINGTVFARAYELDKQLARNKSWESVPYNIPGIYEKTILPYLREENPDQLANAWDKRIEQETRVVQFLEKEKERQQRGSADDKRATRNKQNKRRQGGGGGDGPNILRTHDKEYFIRETLPTLKWGKMVDMFSYGNSSRAALEMLGFIKENIKSPRAETWMNQFAGLLSRSVAPERTIITPRPSETPVSSGSTSSDGAKAKPGSAPSGLEPKN